MSKKIFKRVREEQEKSYTEFYSRFIEDHYRTDEEFIDGVKNALDSGDILHGAFEIGDKLEIYQFAYLLQFGVHDACLGEEAFSESALKCPKLTTFCSKERINICCLGSQALLSVLGVCKVLDEYVQMHKFSHEDRTRVQIFIIDKNKTWKVLSEYIVNAAKKEYPALKLKLNFLIKDATKSFSEEVATRIELSHIVTMVKYLSSLNSKDTVAKVTKITLKEMKKNAVLLYWDHDTRGDFDKLKKQIVETKSFSEINSFSSPEKYTLQKGTKALHQSSYQFLSPLNTLWDTNAEPVTFSTWIKNPDVKMIRVENKQTIPVTEDRLAVSQSPEDPDKFYRPKRSSDTKRNSDERFRLVGKFARKDMEKKNKNDSSRQMAKRVSVSRHVEFDDRWRFEC